jgi:hypothetical protein
MPPFVAPLCSGVSQECPKKKDVTNAHYREIRAWAVRRVCAMGRKLLDALADPANGNANGA